MNKEYEERYFKVFYHFIRVPKFMRRRMKKEFMKNRNEVARIFREHIKAVNDEWNLTGKEFAFGEYIEDINPEYSKLVYDRIQPFIDVANKSFPYCKYLFSFSQKLQGLLRRDSSSVGRATEEWP